MQNVNVKCLSHPISKRTPLYGGVGEVAVSAAKAIAQGDQCNTLALSFGNHTSTHVDFPAHFLADGKTISDYKMNFFFLSRIQIVSVDVACGRAIEADLLDAEIKDCEIILLKTGMEEKRETTAYYEDPPYVKADLAMFLKNKAPSLRFLGVDMISIASPKYMDVGCRAHNAFLEKDILLLEDMKLSELSGCPDTIIISPLLIEQADAAPVTVFALYERGGEG